MDKIFKTIGCTLNIRNDCGGSKENIQKEQPISNECNWLCSVLEWISMSNAKEDDIYWYNPLTWFYPGLPCFFRWLFYGEHKEKLA